MNWYYADGGRQAGPVDQQAFDQLVATGAIQAATLVWREGMAGWKPYGEVAPPPTPPPSLPVPAAPDAAAPRFCGECGAPNSADDMIRFGNTWVCPNCKNVFAQKLREGVSLTGARQYGGFWIRFVARIIDGILLYVVSLLINLVVLAAPTRSGAGLFTGIFGILFVVQIGIAVTYEALFLVNYQATLGKLAVGLRVITADGGKISAGLAIGRYFAQWVSSFTLGIGYIMAAFDDEKRALHDRICNTRVVKK